MAVRQNHCLKLNFQHSRPFLGSDLFQFLFQTILFLKPDESKLPPFITETIDKERV
jgi:hypothetical protein